MHSDPVLGAQRMEAAERRKGVQYGDTCRQCVHFDRLWGAEYCMKEKTISQEQFHLCVKYDDFERSAHVSESS